jgi:DNA-binding response OmpR family regulator
MSETPLLIIDDDMKLARLLKDYLTPLGYEVDVVHNGAAGLKKAIEQPYAAIILDVMLPGMNGMEVLRELRRESNVPVLMLTALGDEPDRIAGLEVGADDYVPKTFSTRELLARLRAVLRRSQMSARVRDFEVFDRSIDVHISSLRRKLGDDAKSPRWIETVRGAGYRLKKSASDTPL